MAARWSNSVPRGATLGRGHGPDGEIFFSQANGNHVDHVVMPEWALARGRVGRATSYQNIEDHNRSFPMMQAKQQAYVQIDWWAISRPRRVAASMTAEPGPQSTITPITFRSRPST